MNKANRVCGLFGLSVLCCMVLSALSSQGFAADDQCLPTPPDMLGPFYKPGAPVRVSVGTGYTLQGTVRSARDCSPVFGAAIEVWLAGPDGRYSDEYRATLFADKTGRYRFRSGFPADYGFRPPHIHMRVTADGFDTLVTQHYPEEKTQEGRFDLVLVPKE